MKTPTGLPSASGTKTFRWIWGVGAILLVGAVGLRIHNSRQTVVHSEHCLNSHDAVALLEQQAVSLPPAEKAAFLRRAIRDENHGWRYAAIDLLAEEGSAEALDLVERAFNDNYSETRKRAAEVLISMPNGEERGLRLLLAALRDEDSWVRESAISQLKLRVSRAPGNKDRRVIPMLIRALTDDDITVAALASSALQQQTGKSWHFSALADTATRQQAIQRWQDWWRAESVKERIPAEFQEVPLRLPTHTDPAPEFFERDLDGRVLHTSDLKGKLTLINFWGTWCPPCRAEIPDLTRLADDYRNKNVEVVGIAFSEPTADSLRKWCQEHGVHYRQSLGQNGVHKGFGDIEDVPVTFLIGPDGRIHNIWDGERDYNTFKAAIDRLLTTKSN